MEKNKQTLLQKYAIPLNHLDFGYIEKCTNGKEMEKIVQILRSGQEGYYPDLTKCAEDKLRELMPGSKLFRVEERLLSRSHLDASDWQPIYDWTSDIKTTDKKLAALNVKGEEMDLPPVRKQGKILANKNDENKCKNQTTKTADKSVVHRVASTDYRKWDKYDADGEMLKIDLESERINEHVERMNRANLQKSAQSKTPAIRITEIVNDDEKTESGIGDSSAISKLTKFEKQNLAEDYRVRGNDYFKAGEFVTALEEYTRCIQLDSSGAAAAYNNRAITNLKLKRYTDAIDDCDSCLRLEESNVKALLRKGEALMALGRKRDAYDVYFKAKTIDESNSVAASAIAAIISELGEIAPPTARRMQITEGEGKLHEAKKNSKQKNDYNFADLIVPNRIVKNKLENAVESLGCIKPKNPPAPVKRENDRIPQNKSEIRMVTSKMDSAKGGRPLIEEL